MTGRQVIWQGGMAALVVLVGVRGAMAQDCATAISQAALTNCAGMEYEAQDKRLNVVWKQAIARMQDIDDGLSDAQKGAESNLRAAQRAWITYRDQGCTAESYQVYGGTAQPMVMYGCMARVTAQRSDELEALAFGGN